MTDITGLKWKTEIVELIASYPPGCTFTADRVRIDSKNKGFSPPTDNHAWGSVFLTASEAWLIKKTGIYIQSQLPENHRRMVAQWMRTDFCVRAKSKRSSHKDMPGKRKCKTLKCE